MVDNALGYADRYALDAGFRRCASRFGISNSRASWFTRDVPSGVGNAEWYLYEDAVISYLLASFRVAPYRMAEGMPLSDALRGSISGQSYVYQYVFRSSALVLLLVWVWLTPTASRRNRVMLTEVVTRAMEARHRQMCAGPRETYEVERYDNGCAPWAYNSVLGSFAGTVLFGNVVNDVRRDAGMLQVRFAAAAPNAGGHHCAFLSDCLPWPTRNGSFDIGAPVRARHSRTSGKVWTALVRVAAARATPAGFPVAPPVCPAAESVAIGCFC